MIRRATVLILLAFIVLAGTWSLLHSGYFRGHDFVHAARIAEMDRALQAGHIPPRWSANFGYGYGMPLFNFYAPLPYIVGAVLYQFVSVVTAIKLLVVIATLGTAFGAYKLSRELTGHTASLLAALAATVAPYRAVNIFVRGALSEIWGMAWMPWVFLGASRVVRSRGGFLILTFSVAGMVLSHNLVALMTIVVSGTWSAFALVYELLQKKIKLEEIVWRSVRLVLGYMTGFGLAAWYVLPSLLEKQFTRLDATILTGYFDFRLHFLYIRQLITNSWGYGGSEWGPNDGISFFLGFGQLFAVALVVGYLSVQFAQVWRRKQLHLHAMHFYSGSILLIVLATLFLTLTHAQPLWEAVPFLQYLQFPWRWLSVVSLLLALLVAYAYELTSTRFAKISVALCLVFLLVLPVTHFQPESWLDTTDSLYYTDSDRIQTHMSEILPDYIPTNVAVEVLPTAEAIIIETEHTKLVEHTIKRPHEHLLSVEQLSAGTVEFSVAYFPGWRVEINGTPALIEPAQNGLISVSVPQGKQTISLFLTESPVRKVADLISIVSAAAILWYWLANRRKEPVL